MAASELVLGWRVEGEGSRLVVDLELTGLERAITRWVNESFDPAVS
jgi:hypothetical protein